MLQEALRRGKKNGQTNLIPISGRVAVLNLQFAQGRPGFQPTVENLSKGRHGSGGFFGGFWVRKMQKKNPPKNSGKIRQPKTKNPLAHDRPKIHQPGPTTHRKTYQQIPIKPPNTRWFFDLEGSLLEVSSEHGRWDTLCLPSGHGRGSHAEMHLQSLSWC